MQPRCIWGISVPLQELLFDILGVEATSEPPGQNLQGVCTRGITPAEIPGGAKELTQIKGLTPLPPRFCA